MGDKTGIEWTDATWNPIVGCTIVSPGCTNCYAMKHAARMQRMNPATHYAGTTIESKAGSVWSGVIKNAPDSIFFRPMQWRRPRKIFVNSMGDLFHEGIANEEIDSVFAVMILAKAINRQHVFQILTKRSARMKDYFEAGRDVLLERWAAAPRRAGFTIGHDPDAAECAIANSINGQLGEGRNVGWPLSNIWLGISAEDQRRADERVPDLLDTPAAVRFVSAEPLLGPIDFRSMPFLNEDTRHHWDALTGQAMMYVNGIDGQPDFTVRMVTPIREKLDWIIVGGESGPGARPMDPEWARSISVQCVESWTAFYMKQMSGERKQALPPIPADLMIRNFPRIAP